MNYYNEIKEQLIKSEIYDRAKDYSKDRHKVKVYFEIGRLLNEAGHNTYRYDGYEADDLVTYLAQNYKDVFDYTIIYTPDKDLKVNE